MPTEIIVTPLPNGVSAAGVDLSIHVAPRLTTPGSANRHLDDFPLMADWPAALSQAGIEVTIDGVPHRASVVSTTSSQLWRALFPSDRTGVFSHVVPDYSGAPVHSFPAAAIESFLEAQYGQFGTEHPGEYPGAVDLLAPARLGPIRFSGVDGARRRDELMVQLADERSQLGHNPSTATALDPAKEFVQVFDFHTPPTATMLPEIPLIDIDFHRAVTLVQTYPTLLRQLGLVIDVRLPIDSSVPQGTVGIQCDVDWSALQSPLSPPAMVRPIVAAEYQIAPGRFVAKSSTVAAAEALRVVDGQLPLNDASRYRVVRVDTDGGAEKLSDLAGGVHRSVALHPTVDTPERYSLPSLRSAGIAVARVGMGGQLHESTVRSQQINQIVASNGAPGLFAEDLTRGCRVDVFDVAAGRWFPLCARRGSIQVASEPPLVEDTEGWVSAAPTSAADGSAPDLYVPETLFHWDGWSLVVERPGAQLANRPDAAGNTVPGEQPEPNAALSRTPDVAHPDVDLVHRFTVPAGTLPKLRFGSRYRLRARTVDLAGNGEPFGDPANPDFSRATPEFVYRRFEPVQSPSVHLRTKTLPGEEVERVVIRTDNDTGAATTGASERHVVPPKQAQIVAEHLRLLDDATGAFDASTYALLADRDPVGVRVDANNPLADGRFDDVYRFDVAEMAVKYLPDGLARHAALAYASGPHAGTSMLVDFPGTWPDQRAFRLRAIAGSGLATMAIDNSSERVLDVPLRPADIITLRISSAFDGGDEDLFGVWEWIERFATTHNIALGPIRDRAGRGGHWMLTPFRPLTLVHAVKRPLSAPLIDLLQTARQLGDTFAELRGSWTVDRPSTQEIDVLGTWTMPVDLGPGGAPPDVGVPVVPVTESIAFTTDFDYGPVDPTPLNFYGRHEFGDTRRRDITYRLRATSRFADYFLETIQFGAPAGGLVFNIDSAGIAPGTAELRGPDGPVEPAAYVIDAVAGTLTFPNGASVPPPPTGAPLELRYVPGSITETSATEFRVVPSSARPAAPSVQYVIPTFGWEQGSGARSNFSTRRGGGLRVYLDRPWWSSGVGELLGVVTFVEAEPGGANPTTVPDDLAPFVTQWGNDPIYDGPSLPTVHPRLDRFPDSVATDTNLSLAEGDFTVNVAGHEVGFDPTRDLWYCDLRIDMGAAYNPLIRLALARYQPESALGAHLSPVVLTDFAQLAPDRFTTLTRTSKTVRRVVVSGPSYTATEAGIGVGEVEVQVEQRDERWGDETLGWRPVGNAQRLRHDSRLPVPTWSGQVTLPSRGPARLVVTQYEVFRVDDGGIGTRGGRRTGKRPVYIDTLPLT